MIKTFLSVTDRERDTILAALRHYQASTIIPDAIRDIANNDHDNPLDADEIDALCEDINCSVSGPPQVLIHMDGGLVQDILADSDVRAVVLDYDTDGASRVDLFDIPQLGGGVSEGFVSDWGTIRGTKEDAEFIVGALAASPTYPKLKACSLRAEAKGYNTEEARAALLAEADRLDQLVSETEEEEREQEIEEREQYGRKAFLAGLRRECNPISESPERPDFAERRDAWFRGYDAEAAAKAEVAA